MERNIEFVKNVKAKFDMLQEKYKEIYPKMIEKFGYSPKIEKVVVNVGFGRLISGKTPEEQRKISDPILNDLAFITGQRPILTRAKKSISSFKIREGQSIGAKVTLRGKRMNDFLERLIQIALPRSRDFQGIDRSCIDKEGNLTIGIREHICFPEISPEKVKNIFGFEITVVTTAKNREEGIEFLKLIGFPIKS